MFLSRAAALEGEGSAETVRATHRSQAAHSQVLTPGVIPALPALVPAIAHRDAPPSGSARMPAARAELSDIPVPSLLQTPAADQMEPDFVFLIHKPMIENTNPAVPNVRLNQPLATRRDRETSECPSARKF